MKKLNINTKLKLIKFLKYYLFHKNVKLNKIIKINWID